MSVIVTKTSDLRHVNFIEGATILVNKPMNWTSFDVVNKLRHSIKRICNVKKVKVGHAGTLDPLAKGLLIVCTGKNTKVIDSLQGMSKVYEAEITLGAVTPSFDLETDTLQPKDTKHLNMQEILGAVMRFKGDIIQTPPMYSAVKKNGVPLYKMARKGITVKRDPRKVTIHDIQILNFDNPALAIRARVSKGTYMRSLANDIGAHLDVGGYLSDLNRTSIGDFSSDDAFELEELIVQLEELQKQQCQS